MAELVVVQCCLSESVPSSSFGFSASFALGLAFANDLNKFPTDASFLALVFESDLFNDAAGPGCGVDRPEFDSSGVFSVRAATAGACFVSSFAARKAAAGLTVALIAALATAGAAFAVLRFVNISMRLRKRPEVVYLDVWVLNRAIDSPAFQRIAACVLAKHLLVADSQQVHVLSSLASWFHLDMTLPIRTSMGPGSTL
jgi:hypothetical protein